MRIWEEYALNGGLLIVFSGPSGVGKDTVFQHFLSLGSGVKKSISCTTRKHRGNEVDGIDYEYLTPEEFARRQSEGFFLESAQYGKYMYGTPREWLEQQIAQGSDIILVIEVMGALEVKRLRPDCVTIFLAPPSIEELERRLRDRNTESEADIVTRLAKAREELQFVTHYDFIIENDSVEKAAQELNAIIIAQRNRVKRGANRL